MSKLNKNPFSIIVRQGTAANIVKPTTISTLGEIGYATDTKIFYISDGTVFNPVNLNLFAKVLSLNDEVILLDDELVLLV